MERLRESLDEASCSYAGRLRVAAAVRQMIVPKRKPGKTKDQRLDKACGDYKAGLRRLELFRKHIPSHDRLSRWRRQAEQRRLMNAIHKRIGREQNRQAATREKNRNRPAAAASGRIRADTC